MRRALESVISLFHRSILSFILSSWDYFRRVMGDWGYRAFLGAQLSNLIRALFDRRQFFYQIINLSVFS